MHSIQTDIVINESLLEALFISLVQRIVFRFFQRFDASLSPTFGVISLKKNEIKLYQMHLESALLN